MKNSNKGFTLIEILVVVAIIGILSSLILVGLNTARKQGRDARRVADLRQVQNGLELYFQTNSGYPNVVTWALLKTELTGTSGPGGISNIPNDPLCPNGICGSSWTDYTYAQASGSYVLRTKLETNNSVLQSDVDGTVNGIDCSDTLTNYYYCIQM